jgi:hypothetical protein
MRNILVITAITLCVVLVAFTGKDNNTIAAGKQPQLAVDPKGKIRIVYGLEDQIFCATSDDNGRTFSKPDLVGKVDKMHLGMTRGPQLASSAHYTLVTAMDKEGNIHSFQLNHATGKWSEGKIINDIQNSAPEGLMSVAADEKDNFYAVWLDVRKDKTNNICFATSPGKTGTWTKNKLVYLSPDGHVCECCKPSIAVKGDKIALMFRNWLNGSRDLYMMQSSNGGKSFGEAQKLGNGTWKLNGCPMDGGGITIDQKGAVHTAWRREGVVYYEQPGQQEVAVSNGKICSISGKKNPVISWQEGAEVKLKSLNTPDVVTVGEGGFLKTVELADGSIVGVWENKGNILFKKL